MTAGGQEPRRWICSLQKLFTGQLLVLIGAFPLFFLCAYAEQVVFLLMNSNYCKRKKLDIRRCSRRSKSKGKPRAF